MRLNRVWLMAVVCGALAGCAGAKPQGGPAWFQRIYPLRPALAPDSIQMEIALVRQPLGDRYLNDDLWRDVDEQAVDQKPLLEANGLRVGTLSRNTPARLHNLLTSERTCIEPHQLTIKAGSTSFLALGPADAPCALNVHQDGETIPVNFERAQWGLSVQATLTEDGRTLLRFEPCVQQGTRSLLAGPAKDRSGWTLLPGKTEEKYAKLGWELALAPNEYAIIGGLMHCPQTVGQACFLKPDAQQPVQHVLLIRTNRSAVSAPRPAPEPAASQASSHSGPPPLALQSVMPRNPVIPARRQVQPPTQVRGKSP